MKFSFIAAYLLVIYSLTAHSIEGKPEQANIQSIKKSEVDARILEEGLSNTHAMWEAALPALRVRLKKLIEEFDNMTPEERDLYNKEYRAALEFYENVDVYSGVIKRVKTTESYGQLNSSTLAEVYKIESWGALEG